MPHSMSDGSARGPAGPAASLPRTPHHLRRVVAIDERIRSLEAEWRLGLKVRDENWSPGGVLPDDQPDKIYGMVQRLFWYTETALDEAIGSFRELAPVFPHEERLSLLSRVLTSKLKKDGKTPPSRTGRPRNDPPKSLKQSLISEYALITSSTYALRIVQQAKAALSRCRTDSSAYCALHWPLVDIS